MHLIVIKDNGDEYDVELVVASERIAIDPPITADKAARAAEAVGKLLTLEAAHTAGITKWLTAAKSGEVLCLSSDVPKWRAEKEYDAADDAVLILCDGPPAATHRLMVQTVERVETRFAVQRMPAGKDAGKAAKKPGSKGKTPESAPGWEDSGNY